MSDYPSSNQNGFPPEPDEEDIIAPLSEKEVREIIRQELVSYGLIEGSAEDE